jgi:hypothetical protein
VIITDKEHIERGIQFEVTTLGALSIKHNAVLAVGEQGHVLLSWDIKPDEILASALKIVSQTDYVTSTELRPDLWEIIPTAEGNCFFNILPLRIYQQSRSLQ